MKMYRFVLTATLALFFFALILSGCKREDQPAIKSADTTKVAPATQSQNSGTGVTLNDKAKLGQLLFYNTTLGKVRVACATCHADGTPKTQLNQIHMGHTLAGVTSRTATWNGMYKETGLKKFAYGGALCAAVFQKRADIKTVNKALSTDEVDAINEYLTALNSASGAMTTNLKIQWVAKPTFSDDPPDPKVAMPAAKAIMKLPGDPASGETIFGKSCGTCHSINDKKIGPPMVKAAKDLNMVVQTVRFGSGGMAFYGEDVLSDQQIADAIAYIQSQLGK